MNEPMDRSAMIDAYLDGAMSEGDRGAFELALRSDPELAREFELQKRIDARLRVLAAVPEMPALPGAGGATRIDRGKNRLPTWARLAALLVLCAIGAWAALNQPWKAWMGPAPADVAANVAFKELVSGGLKPQWKCESDEVFAKYTREHLGAEFTIKPKPGVEVVGWTYSLGLLEGTSEVLMCRVDGKASIVVMGKKENDRAMRVDAGSGVRVHRKEIWGLVMYEVNEREDAPISGLIVGPGCGK